MVKLGEINSILKQIKDELTADDAPADLSGLTPSQLRAELEARGLLDSQEAGRNGQRRKSAKRLKRYYRAGRRK